MYESLEDGIWILGQAIDRPLKAQLEGDIRMEENRLTPKIISQGIKPEWCSKKEWYKLYVDYLQERRRKMNDDEMSRVVKEMESKHKKKEHFTEDLTELSKIEGVIYNPLSDFTTKQLKKELKRRKKYGR